MDAKSVFVIMIVASLFLFTRPGGDLSMIFRFFLLIGGVVGFLVCHHRELKRNAKIAKQQLEMEKDQGQKKSGDTSAKQN